MLRCHQLVDDRQFCYIECINKRLEHMHIRLLERAQLCAERGNTISYCYMQEIILVVNLNN
jgi:hypothetical protein